MLVGDINQSLHYKRVKKIFLKLGVCDVFSTIYEIPMSRRDKMFVRGVNCIDTVAVFINILPFISNIKLIDFSKIVSNNHIEFL